MIGWDDHVQLALSRLLPASMYDALMVRMMKL
jgi:hypothetical protein